MFFFFKQKTAYEMRISDWSSDVCSSDLRREHRRPSRFSPVQLGFPSSCGAFRASDQVSLLQFLPKLRRVLQQDRKGVVEGQGVSVRVELGGSRLIKKTHRDTIESSTR